MNTPKDLLADIAISRMIGGLADSMRPSRGWRDGDKIPDRYLPGRVIMGLSPEKRDLLKQLKSEDLQVPFMKELYELGQVWYSRTNPEKLRCFSLKK